MEITHSKATDNDLREFDLNYTASADKEVKRTTVDGRTPSYSGDAYDDSGPLKDSKWQTMPFDSPAQLLAVYHNAIRNGDILLHPWQVEVSDEIARETPSSTSNKPYRLALCAANGSGKDAFIVAPFVVWLALTNVRALIIITSSSGVQLTSQTENYIKTLAESINALHGAVIFRVRQRFIKCLLSGSEIRMFATDEAGKAEGYHPLEPGAKMAIVVNEAKSVNEEIFMALRRCTGYTHWLNVSTPGEPKGTFYRNCRSWANFKRITSYDCPHLNEQDREEDKLELGEHSALFRSKHLALFTSLDGESIISLDVINRIIANKPPIMFQDWPDRVGIDLAAGGDETTVYITKGNRIKVYLAFREVDTTITTDKIEAFLTQQKIPKEHEFLFADDGGIGHAIIDMLVRRGWNVKRIRNETRALQPKNYGNRGAELWYHTKRILEENLFNLDNADEKLKEQLGTRRYKKSNTGGRVFLESKRDAKLDGLKSPDRADGFVLSLTGLTVDDFLKQIVVTTEERTKIVLHNADEVFDYYVNQMTYQNFKPDTTPKQRIFNSLHSAINNDN